MAKRVGVGNVRPRAEREGDQHSITERQRMVRVPITDLNAEIRRRRRRRVTRALKRVTFAVIVVTIAAVLSIALVWLCGKGTRR